MIRRVSRQAWTGISPVGGGRAVEDAAANAETIISLKGQNGRKNNIPAKLACTSTCTCIHDTSAASKKNAKRLKICHSGMILISSLFIIIYVIASQDTTLTIDGKKEKLPPAFVNAPIRGWLTEWALLTGLIRLTPSNTKPIEKDACCFHVQTDLEKKFTPGTFRTLKRIAPHVTWTGKEYEEWLYLSQTSMRDDGNATSKRHCLAQWNRLVMDQSPVGRQLSRQFMDQLLAKDEWGTGDTFQYIEDDPSLPRVLILGDSISIGTWELFRHLHRNIHLVNIHTASANCGGNREWDAYLNDWLGTCPWDVIHFNIGQHFYGWRLYQRQLPRYVETMQKHSPNAKIVFATTTPSPFDNPETVPNKSDCKHYNKLRPKGFAPKLNEIARRLLEPMNVTFNDRYAAIMPHLKEHQKYCDIHLERSGYDLIARQDWRVIASLLDLNISGLES